MSRLTNRFNHRYLIQLLIGFHVVLLTIILHFTLLYHTTDVQLLHDINNRTPSTITISRLTVDNNSETIETSLNLTDIQYIVDAYMDLLSKQYYAAFNDELHINYKANDYLFERYSLSSLDTLFRNLSIFITGDSMQFYFAAFIASQLHLYELGNANNCKCKLFENSLAIQPSTYHLVHPYSFYNIFNERTATFEGYWQAIKNSANWTAETSHRTQAGSNVSKLVSVPHFAGLPLTKFRDLYFWNSYGLLDVADYHQQLSAIPVDGPLDVIYINFAAFHLLHLYPWRPYEQHIAAGHSSASHALYNIVYLETHFDSMVSAAIDHGAKCLIFRAANPVCDMKFDAGYAKAKQYYDALASTSNKSSTSSIFDECLQKYGIHDVNRVYLNYSYKHLPSLQPHVIKGSDFCSERYTLLNYGANEFNERMSKYVRNKQVELDHTRNSGKLKLIYYNVNKLFSENFINRCVYSDSRHYQKLMPLQVTAVTNIIRQFCV